MYIYLAFLLCATSHQDDASCEPRILTIKDSPDAIQILERRLRDKESQLRSTLFRYSAALDEPTDSWSEDGYWVQADATVVIQAQTRVGKRNSWIRAVWDGASAYIVEASGDGAALLEPVDSCSGAVRVAIDDHRWIPPFNHGYMPLYFGLGMAGRYWSTILKEAKTARVLGRESLFATDCLVVELGLGSELAPGNLLTTPVLVWFDDGDKLIARRVVTFLPPGAAFNRRFDSTRVQPSEQRTIGNDTWIAFEHWDVLETALLTL